MFEDLIQKKKRIGVVGLGYVGLPIALEFAKYFSVIGFDINADRVALMNRHIDPSNELDSSAFEGKDIVFTANPEDMRQAHFFVIAVPTPVNDHKVPDLTALLGASKTVGKVLKKGDYVVFESTVYPGCTEEDCVPVLEALSGMKMGADFKVGYSPERINPGDKEHTIEKILKIVSGCDEMATATIAAVYGRIILAGIYQASSIKVAEAAKVIENTQRDINIALMNELAVIFDKMGIDTQEVIKAAGTKWNFLKFYPGLVGGHCIGVDPYYLTYKSMQLGYNAEVITSGRRINDSMPGFIAKKLVQMLIHKGKSPQQCKVLVMGITFKENVSDIRNSKVADLVNELMGYSVNVHITDPHASPDEVAHEYQLTMTEFTGTDYDAVIVAVSHSDYLDKNMTYFQSIMKDQPILMDLKGIYQADIATDITYWRL
jgi:UDP-N-acetyl-D-galactosamine dehydrogenase